MLGFVSSVLGSLGDLSFGVISIYNLVEFVLYELSHFSFLLWPSWRWGSFKQPLFLKGNPVGTGRSEGSSNGYLMDKVDGKGRSVSSTTIKKGLPRIVTHQFVQPINHCLQHLWCTFQVWILIFTPIQIWYTQPNPGSYPRLVVSKTVHFVSLHCGVWGQKRWGASAASLDPWGDPTGQTNGKVEGPLKCINFGLVI